METLKFPYVKAKRLEHYEFAVYDGRVALAPLLQVMGLSARSLRFNKAMPPSSPGQMGQAKVEGILIEDLDDWLRKVGSLSAVAKHFADHFYGFVSGNSVELHAQAAMRKIQEAKRAEQSSVICEPLTSSDFYRRDASIGPKRQRPEVIDASARAGFLDVFVRPEPTIWETQAPLQHVSIDLAEAYHPNLLRDLKGAHREVLSGLDMVEQYPNDPRVKRRMVPSRRAVKIEGGRPTIIQVPEHPQIFPWERAIMETATNEDDIELPGSPYHRKRPAWFGV